MKTTKKEITTIEREEIKNTPFELIKIKELYYISYGNTPITKGDITKEAALSKLKNNAWEIITYLIVLINLKIKENEKNKRN